MMTKTIPLSTMIRNGNPNDKHSPNEIRLDGKAPHETSIRENDRRAISHQSSTPKVAETAVTKQFSHTKLR